MNEAPDVVMHHIGTLIINVQPENQCDKTAKCDKKKNHLAKTCRSERRKQQKTKEVTERDDTADSDIHESKKNENRKKTRKHQKNHITEPKKADGTEKEAILDIRATATLFPPDKEIMRNKKVSLMTRKCQDVNESGVKFTGRTTVEAESRRVRKDLTTFITR